MGNKTPVHGTGQETSKEVFGQLDAARKAGTLADTPEYSNEAEKAQESPEFNELSDEGLLKLTKAEMLDYMKRKLAHEAALAKAEMEQRIADEKRGVLQGFPMQPKGGPVPVGDNIANHPGRGIPYQKLGEDGEPRVNKKGQPVMRTDN